MISGDQSDISARVSTKRNEIIRFTSRNSFQSFEHWLSGAIFSKEQLIRWTVTTIIEISPTLCRLRTWTAGKHDGPCTFLGSTSSCIIVQGKVQESPMHYQGERITKSINPIIKVRHCYHRACLKCGQQEELYFKPRIQSSCNESRRAQLC